MKNVASVRATIYDNDDTTRNVVGATEHLDRDDAFLGQPLGYDRL